MEMPDGPTRPSRNLVVFCDGTDDEFRQDNTNVVRLLSLALQRDEQQIVFYEPGLGTFPSAGAWTAVGKWITKTLGAAFGLGLSRNIAVCYEFLVENYAPGDRIFLFGFSRGAYTARALAALIHVCGLMHTKNRNLVPYIVDLFKSESVRAKKKNDRDERSRGEKIPLALPVCSAFKEIFSATPEIHFMGLWDTVASVGSIYNPFKLPYTRWNPSVLTVRHAVSIDEERKFFRANLWSSSHQSTDVKQMWFTGDHGDIGGEYPERESGLAKITLEWMLEQGRAAQLLIDEARLPLVFPLTDAGSHLVAPNPVAILHNELRRTPWKILQWIPRRVWRRDKRTGQFSPKWNLSPRAVPRYMPEGSLIHASVRERMAREPDYRPANLRPELLNQAADEPVASLDET